MEGDTYLEGFTQNPWNSMEMLKSNEAHKQAKPKTAQKAFSTLVIEITTKLVRKLETKQCLARKWVRNEPLAQEQVKYQMRKPNGPKTQANYSLELAIELMRKLAWFSNQTTTNFHELEIARKTYLKKALAQDYPIQHERCLRSNPGKLHAYDPEIDKAFHSIAFASDPTNNANCDSDITNFDSDVGICISQLSLDNMANNDRTLKELATLDITYQPWCIRYPEWEQAQSYELKSRLTHLLPKFHGLVGNTQQFCVRGSTASRVVNEVVVADNQRLENKIIEQTFLVRKLTIGQHHICPLVRVCGICAFVEHSIDACPTLQETKPNNAEIDAIMGGVVDIVGGNIARVVEVVAIQPPLPSIVQSLQPLAQPSLALCGIKGPSEVAASAPTIQKIQPLVGRFSSKACTKGKSSFQLFEGKCGIRQTSMDEPFV
ncbi:hypothetical protein CR513_00282, partial [Mucuna pruriens]